MLYKNARGMVGNAVASVSPLEAAVQHAADEEVIIQRALDELRAVDMTAEAVMEDYAQFDGRELLKKVAAAGVGALVYAPTAKELAKYSPAATVMGDADWAALGEEVFK